MDEPKATDAAALDASILPTMAAAEATLQELDAVVKPEPTIDALNVNTYAGPPPRTSGRRRKPSVLVHQVSVDEDDGGLYVQPAPRPVYQGGVRLSALRVKQLVDSDRTTLDRDEICEAMDVDGKVSQTDYGRCGGMLSGRLGPNKFIVDYAKGLRSKCKRHRCKHAFRDGELRVGKIPPRARKDVPARRVHWYHPACIFKSFERASKKTKTIDTIDEIEGFEELHKSDQRDLARRVDDWAARKAESLATYKPKKKKARRESPSAVALALAVAEAAAAPMVARGAGRRSLFFFRVRSVRMGLFIGASRRKRPRRRRLRRFGFPAPKSARPPAGGLLVCSLARPKCTDEYIEGCFAPRGVRRHFLDWASPPSSWSPKRKASARTASSRLYPWT